jgi:SAM-dependent methyltransferase
MYETVKKYYGKVLAGSGDLKTNACCTPQAMPAYVRDALSRVHEDVVDRYYGCGLVVPPLLEGARVLDLGCGAGRDCYLLAQLVGEGGEVVGVDMTPEQLAVARAYLDEHARRFGYRTSNLRFLQGYLERLDELDLEPASFDVIVSNCVINLSPDKRAVLEQAHRLLKPGGELYFADVYADRRVPEALACDPLLYSECLGGALYWNDFLALARASGFSDPRLVEDRSLDVGDEALRARLGAIRFHSATCRLFRIDGLEPACEDYGQVVTYRGTVRHCETTLAFDRHYRFERARLTPVCGNTYRMLRESRLRPHFDFFGNRETHYGPFPGCGNPLPFAAASGDGRGGGATCCG